VVHLLTGFALHFICNYLFFCEDDVRNIIKIIVLCDIFVKFDIFTSK